MIHLPISKSSHIQSIHHNPNTNDLHVVFNNGDKYIYREVDSNKAASVTSAKSAGSWLNENIKKQHKFTKIN